MTSIVDNVSIEPQCIGAASLYVTHPDKCSMMRQDMLCKALSSRQEVSGAEFPHMYSGFEQHLKEYVHGSRALANDIKILEVIPKFTMQLGVVGIEHNPKKTIIYRDLETGEVGFFDICRYTELSSGYGYYNTIHPYNLTEGTVLRKDEKLVSSPSIRDGLYCMGVNANAVYLSREDTTEDAIPISQTLADKLSPLKLERVTLNLDLSKFPLNVHGDESVYGIVPNLGEHVGKDGIVAAFRKVNDASMFDLLTSRIDKVQYLHDDVMYATPNSKVIDIDVIANRLPNGIDLPTGVYDTIFQYHEQTVSYYRRVYAAYCKYHDSRLDITKEFNTLVTTAMTRLLTAGQPVKGMKKSPCRLVHKGGKDFNIIVELVLAKQVPVKEGSKLSDGYGNKGVVVNVIPDEDMPVDENGFRADIIIDTTSPLKRTNVGQFRVHAINRAAKWVASQLHKIPTVKARFKQVCDFLNLVNPHNVAILEEAYNTDRLKERYINLCMEDTIYIFHPPTCIADTDENITKMYSQFNVPVSPVSFNITDANGNKKRITTKAPAAIGSKYIYLLHKYPKPIASSFGYVSKLHIVTKNKFKLGAPISNTPCRFGEAEHRMFVVAGCAEEISRMRGLFGNSLTGPPALIDSILKAKKPSRLRKANIDSELLKDNEAAVIGANNMVRTLGIETREILITEKEASGYFRTLSDLEERIANGEYS